MDRVKIDTVLFDFDGVIIDSNAVLVDIWKKLANQYNISLNEDDIRQSILGSKTDYAVSKFFSHLSFDIQQDIISQIERSQQDMSCSLLPGFKRFYEQLISQGVRIGIVTNNSWHKISQVFRQHGLGGFFCVVTGKDVNEPKLASDSYEDALSFWQAKPQSTLVFDDSNIGIRAALTAGTHCIAVNNGDWPAVGSISNFDAISLVGLDLFINYQNQNVQPQLSEFCIERKSKHVMI